MKCAHERSLIQAGIRPTLLRVGRLRDFAVRNGGDYEIIVVSGQKTPPYHHRYIDYIKIGEPNGAEERYFAVADRPLEQQQYIERAEHLMSLIGRGCRATVDARHCLTMISYMLYVRRNSLYIRKKNRFNKKPRRGERYLLSSGNDKYMMTYIHPNETPEFEESAFYGC